MKVKTTAVLLALFLGQLGVHRFYLGSKGTGVVMLILTFTLVGIIISLPWAVIDLVRLLIMNDVEFDRRYNASPRQMDNFDQLLKLNELLQAKILTQEEFDIRKAQLLGSP